MYVGPAHSMVHNNACLQYFTGTGNGASVLEMVCLLPGSVAKSPASPTSRNLLAGTATETRC